MAQSEIAQSIPDTLLADSPRPSGCKKLKGGVKEWRIRIGDYRVIYTIEDARKAVDVTRIAHRKEVYKP